jgi:amidase
MDDQANETTETSANMQFNLLTTTAVDLRRLLEAGEITSVQIVLDYLSQVERHDPKLHTFISVAHKNLLLSVAADRDEERRQGRTRGPLHGIPIVLKDSFITASELGMETTAGSWALVGSKSSVNSAIAQRLIDQGLIILGKTNMTVCFLRVPSPIGRVWLTLCL